MVDIGNKPNTVRRAVAEGYLRTRPEVVALALSGQAKKGDVFAVARVAGILAAKRTAEWIPLAHPIPLTAVTVEIQPQSEGFRVEATVQTLAATGVEMEALTAVSAALLTIYDMLKAVDRGMVLEGVRLLEKSGGQSGRYIAERRSGE
ncbi:MAG: cyclic pyranopterin monophosphate synthase MoaC [Firmicutes bacterium]|nr:cyclic pyranopterin monophosphate synthase MoaC [Alicyclobacillaceae bacterium]MCL6497924.1 cyclic pyranopterin monophosphate synthase MoaC [Bacillota bacterium]